MAALLRSARLLKCSPSGLLHITGTKRNGPPLSRLYCGVIGGRRVGLSSRHISPGPGLENASRHVWAYAAGGMRGFAVASELRDESLGVRSKQAQQFDWALAKLDSSVRRTGRITKTLLLRIFHDICRTGYPSSNQALLLLRSCGSLLPEMVQEERNELAHRIWEKLLALGVSYDVSHYNALLKVYLQNEFKFSPTEFLAKMEADNVQPNRVTYQRLIAAYCQNGDIEGASTILGFMKSKDLPITEAVFNSLVTGHARAGDIDSAKNILPVMQGAGIEPGPDTYVALLSAYAEKGDMDNIKKTLEAVESADCSLMDRDIMQVIFSLAKAGHQQHVPEMTERMRHERGYVPDAMNLCLSLITHGQDDTAFQILKSFSALQQADGMDSDTPCLGNFFLRHCVSMNTPVEKIGKYCKELQDSNRHATPLQFTLSCALEAKMNGMCFELMKMLKEQDLPIRSHYFWPLLTGHVKDGNTAGVLEVVKGMKELDVAPDVDTFTNYILPAFPNLDATRQALQDAGCTLESEGFMSSEVREKAASSSLAELYTMLSDPSFPPMALLVFRGSLIAGFKKSSDVESMVKITELLCNDERFFRQTGRPSDSATGAFFLYSLMDSMSENEVQEQEEKLRKFFSQLKAQNLTISGNIFRGIRNILDPYQVPELIKDVAALVDTNNESSYGFGLTDRQDTATSAGDKGLFLEKKLAELKAEGKPLSGLLKQVLYALCLEKKLERALELKELHVEEMTAGGYATLISFCCRHDNLDEALNLKRELSRKDSSITLDPNKYIDMINALCKHDRLEEAVDLLKEMKEKDVATNDMSVAMLFHMLTHAATKCGPDAVRQLQDAIFILGLAKPSTNLCSPLVTAYLEREDLLGALEAAIDCQKRYKCLPRIHDIIVGMVEKGDTELLQKAMDFVNQTRGEMTMYYDLFFAFMATGRYREARKIIETPGLRARPGRLQWYAERCIAEKKMDVLEQLVDVTAKLFECDRDEMYSYILRLCKETDNWQKAEAMWTKMQEENVIPRERTLHMLADILKKNGQEVPFQVPEVWYEQAATTVDTTVPTESASPAPSDPDHVTPTGNNHHRLMVLCKKGKSKGAYEKLKETDKNGVVFTAGSYDHLIRALLAGGHLEDAMEVRDIARSHLPDFQLSDQATNLSIVTLSKRGQEKDALAMFKSMLQADRVPSHLAITRLLQALGNHGDVTGIQDVESLLMGMGLNLSSMVFVNNTALAHIKNGDLDSAVETLEAIYTSPDRTGASIAYIFRKLFEDGNEKAIDKLSSMAERLANHFACYDPATDLFLELLENDKVEDAKFMLARCNAVAEQRGALLSYVARKAKIPGQVGKIQAIKSLIPDFAEKKVFYAYLMKCHHLDKDFASAKALYEQIQEEGVDIDELTLKRLAVIYRNAGERLPFSEPTESFQFYAARLRERTFKAKTTTQDST